MIEARQSMRASTESDPKRDEETKNPKLNSQEDRNQHQPGESTRRYYSRRLHEKFRGITHERHLVYGTWVLAVGTWLLSLLTYCGIRDNEAAIDRSLRAWLAPFSMDIIGVNDKSIPTAFRLTYFNTGKEPATEFNHQQMAGGTVINKKYVDWDNIAFPENRTCEGISTRSNGPVVYPAMSGYHNFYDFYPNLTAMPDEMFQEAANGERILFLQGCLAYRTIAHLHRSAFCFFL